MGIVAKTKPKSAPPSVLDFVKARDHFHRFGCGFLTLNSSAKVAFCTVIPADSERMGGCHTARESLSRKLGVLIQDQGGLCMRVVKPFRPQESSAGNMWDDWMSAANEALAVAATKFVPNKGIWSSFATRYIKGAVVKSVYADENYTITRNEQNIRQALQEAHKQGLTDSTARDYVRNKMGYQVSDEVFDRVESGHRVARMCQCSLFPCECGAGFEYPKALSTHTDDTANAVVEEVFVSQVRQSVTDALSSLKPQQREALVKLFGLDGQPPMSVKEVAKSFGMTPQGVSAMKQRALAALAAGNSSLRHMYDESVA